MTNGISVKKRNGRGVEPLDLEKIHNMVEEACKGVAGVSASQVEIQSGINSMTVSRLLRYKRYSLGVLVISLIWSILTISLSLLDSYYLL